MNSPGKLVVLEGTDGSGKGTQHKALVQYFEKNKIPFQVLDFPRYSSPTSFAVKKYLNGDYGSLNEVTPQQASILFAVDRFDQKQEILDWLEAGFVVLANRYTTSNMVHQASRFEDDKEFDDFITWLENLEFTELGLPIPDLVLFLNVHPEIGQRLIDHRGGKKDLHEENPEHLMASYRRACRLVTRYPYWTEIVCTENNDILPREVITQKILDVLMEQKILEKPMS